jgi:molecular chaperone GrpE
MNDSEETNGTDSDDLSQELQSCYQELAAAQEEARSCKDGLLRALAETENQRKRAARELEKAHKFALAQFLLELLPVKDSLELCLEAADDPAARPEVLLEGMRLTLEKFNSVLSRFGMEDFTPLGDTFDPELHEAITVKDAANVAPNTVIEVHQKGYLLNGRLLRPARVTVSRRSNKT